MAAERAFKCRAVGLDGGNEDAGVGHGESGSYEEVSGWLLAWALGEGKGGVREEHTRRDRGNAVDTPSVPRPVHRNARLIQHSYFFFGSFSEGASVFLTPQSVISRSTILMVVRKTGVLPFVAIAMILLASP